MLVHLDLEREIVGQLPGVTLNKVRMLGVVVEKINSQETHHLGNLLNLVVRVTQQRALVQA